MEAPVWEVGVSQTSSPGFGLGEGTSLTGHLLCARQVLWTSRWPSLDLGVVWEVGVIIVTMIVVMIAPTS